MTKAKKRLLMGASYAAVAALAVSGTLALLTDESHDVNTMTLGNVSIEQHEYQRMVNEDGTYATGTFDGVNSYVLEEFEQGKTIVPVAANPGVNGAPGWDATPVRMTQVGSYGSMQVFEDKSAQDKFVVVENTGKTDAYVRTLVAVECGETDASLIGRAIRAVKPEEDDGTTPWISNYIGIIEVDGNNYSLAEYVYRGASDVDRHVGGVLPGGDTTYPNLAQIYIKSEATNEDCEKLDGNDNGTLDILVVSQAVQTGNFENAEAALDAGFGDITTENHPWADSTVKEAKVYTYGEHTISGDIILDPDGEATDCVTADGKGVVVNILDGTYDSTGKECAVWAKNGATVNIYGGHFKNMNKVDPSSGSHTDLIYAGSDGGVINVYGGTFEVGIDGDWLLNEKDNQGTITVYGGTFKGFDPSNNVAEGAGTNFVAEGYTVVEEVIDGSTWYTVVAK